MFFNILVWLPLEKIKVGKIKLIWVINILLPVILFLSTPLLKLMHPHPFPFVYELFDIKGIMQIHLPLIKKVIEYTIILTISLFANAFSLLPLTPEGWTGEMDKAEFPNRVKRKHIYWRFLVFGFMLAGCIFFIVLNN